MIYSYFTRKETYIETSFLKEQRYNTAQLPGISVNFCDKLGNFLNFLVFMKNINGNRPFIDLFYSIIIIYGNS